MRKIVSSLVIAFLLVFSSPVLAEVYFCVPDDATGFDPKNDYEQHSYNLNRFSVEIDWKNRSMRSEKMWMTGEVKCIYEEAGTLYCLSEYGTTLAVNSHSLKFISSEAFLTKSPNDSMILQHGSCENF